MTTTFKKPVVRPFDRKLLHGNYEISIAFLFDNVRMRIESQDSLTLIGPIRSNRDIDLRPFTIIEETVVHAPEIVARPRRTLTPQTPDNKAEWQSITIGSPSGLNYIFCRLVKWNLSAYGKLTADYERMLPNGVSFVPLSSEEFMQAKREEQAFKEPTLMMHDILSYDEERELLQNQPDTFENAKALKKLMSDVGVDQRCLKDELQDWRPFSNAPLEAVESRIVLILGRAVRLAATKIQVCEQRNALLKTLGKEHLFDDVSPKVDAFRSLLSCLVGVVET